MKKILVLSLIVLLPQFCKSQWEQDVRLTNNPTFSQTFKNSIASDGNDIHVVWGDSRPDPSGSEIYYIRSTNGGITWGQDRRLTFVDTSDGYAKNPSIAVSGQNIYVIYNGDRGPVENPYYEFILSTNGGLEWSSPSLIFYGSYGAEKVSLCTSGSLVHIAKEVYVGGFFTHLGYQRSTNNGMNWITSILDSGSFTGSHGKPSIVASGQNVHVAWILYQSGKNKIYYKNSKDGGKIWDEKIIIGEIDISDSYNRNINIAPAITALEEKVIVVWRKNFHQLSYKRSTDNGFSWDPEEVLANSPDTLFLGNVCLSASNVHVIWQDKQVGSWEVYYKRSINSGISWESFVRITDVPDSSYLPSVSISGTNIHTLWTDTRDGNKEIYYKRNPTGNSTSINIINLAIPKEFSLSQCYPNPFNPTTKIKFDIAKYTPAKLTIYDILGREIATLIHEPLKAGTYEADWNASNYPSGIYFYKLIAGEYAETKKMILVK